MKYIHSKDNQFQHISAVYVVFYQSDLYVGIYYIPYGVMITIVIQQHTLLADTFFGIVMPRVR